MSKKNEIETLSVVQERVLRVVVVDQLKTLATNMGGRLTPPVVRTCEEFADAVISSVQQGLLASSTFKSIADNTKKRNVKSK